MAGSHECKKVAFLAIGSIGDVLSLAEIATLLSTPSCRVSFISHFDHQPWLLPLLEDSQIHFLPLSLPPARSWSAASLHDTSKHPSSSLEQHLEECIERIQAALGVNLLDLEPAPRPLPSLQSSLLGSAPARGGYDSQHPAVSQASSAAERDTRCTAVAWPQRRGPGVQDCAIVHNLFALEAFHIAEALGVPSVAVSPCLVPYPPPASFRARFKASFPDLYTRLQHAGDGVGWAEVELWMWPLFTERWGIWRQNRLLLPAVPFLEAAEPPHAPPLLYCLSNRLVHSLPHWPESVRVCGSCRSAWRQFNPGTRTSVHSKGGHADHSMHNNMTADFSDTHAARQPVCISFGSMGSMGLLGSATRLLQLLLLALKTAKQRAIILTGQWEAMQEACAAASDLGAGQELLALHGFVDYSCLLPRCSAMVHHGGAGTVAAALRAGIPSVICPLHFDQYMWAEQLADMGVGQQLTGKELLEGSLESGAAKLSAALQTVCQSEEMQQASQRIQLELAAEDGAQVAADHIRNLMIDATKPIARQVKPASELLHLPNGWVVHTTSPSEAAFLYREIFGQECYLQHGLSIREGDLVLDAGANIGLFALWAMGGFAGRAPAEVWALEPAPSTAALLQKNVESCGLIGKVHILPVALGKAAGMAEFTYYPRMPGNTTRKPAEKRALQAEHMSPSFFEDSAVFSCQVVTLEDVMQRYSIPAIDLLKIDVEGDELEVLLGVVQWSKVHQIVAEVHLVDGRAEAIMKLLRSKGYLTVMEQGTAPNTAMVYAAIEDRLLEGD